MTTIGGAMRTVVVAWAGVGGRVYRDRAPDDAIYPFVTFLDYANDTEVLSGDGGTLARRRGVVLSLWFDSVETETDALTKSLKAALSGARVVAGDHTMKVNVVNVTRPLPDMDGDVQVIFDTTVAYLGT